MTKKTIKLNEKQFEEINKKIDEEKHNQFVKSLNKEKQSVLEETKKLIEKAESNLLDTENTNLHIVKNISVDLKNALPIEEILQGTDHEKLADFKWNNALLKLFNNKVLIFMMGKNADTIQRDNPLYYRTLRDVSASVVLNLLYDVIKVDENGKCFNNPIGRKPKGIKFNLKKMIKYADDRDYFKKKFNPSDRDDDYISFETFNEIARYIVLKIEKAEEETPLLKKLNAVIQYIDKGNNFYSTTGIADEVEATKDVIHRLFQVACNSQKFNVLNDVLCNLTDNKTYTKFVEFMNKQTKSGVQVKFYPAVKFVNGRQIPITADTPEKLLKQLQQ